MKHSGGGFIPVARSDPKVAPPALLDESHLGLSHLQMIRWDALVAGWLN
jgi:hypothetical protein